MTSPLNDQGSRKAELDLEVVRIEAVERARRALERSDDFPPFAITLSGENDLLSHEVTADAVEGQSTAVEILSFSVRAGMGGSLPHAVALARKVVLRDASASAAMPAVCVALEHVDGLASRWFMPYRRESGCVVWQEPRTTRAVPWFFGAAE